MDILKLILALERRKKRTQSPVFLIKARIKDINQLFNSMDPSPFEERDLDSDAETFIESWAFEYPANSPLALEIIVEQDLPPDKNANFVRSAIHNFYKHKAEIKARELNQLLREGRGSLFVGLFFLGFCFLSSGFLEHYESNTWLLFVKEGLLITGWVSMWKPIQTYLYEWWPLFKKAKIYAKMSRMNVYVKKLGTSDSRKSAHDKAS